MTPDIPRNIAASVRQRLLNRSKSEGRPFQEILQYYAMERFLYRLSQSVHATKFILKGALLLRAWCAPEARPTMDIDVLGKTSNEPDQVVRLIREILSVQVETDGIVFDPSTVLATRITEGADYEGIRVRFRGTLESARVNMQIDVGFGDVVIPESEEVVLPAVLDFPAPRLQGYNRESMVAEKFETLVKLGELNSRMKDFYDIWFLSTTFDFDGKRLAEAIRQTFARRGTDLRVDIAAFSPEFIDIKQSQWRAFAKRLRADTNYPDFAVVISGVVDFLSPIAQAVRAGASIPDTWTASGTWTP